MAAEISPANISGKLLHPRMEDEAELPVLREARAYSNHRDYPAALEIYADILPTIDPQTIAYSHILLEYAQCLVESVSYGAEVSYRRALQLGEQCDQSNTDEDLEIAWDCLETCRASLEVVNDRERLCEVHKGLGDIHSLVNRFEEALKEYHSAYEYCDSPETSLEILECLAECHRSAGEYDEAADFYRQIADQHTKNGNREMADEIMSLIEGMSFVGKHRPGTPARKTDPSPTPRDINHLKRSR